MPRDRVVRNFLCTHGKTACVLWGLLFVLAWQGMCRTASVALNEKQQLLLQKPKAAAGSLSSEQLRLLRLNWATSSLRDSNSSHSSGDKGTRGELAVAHRGSAMCQYGIVMRCSRSVCLFT